MEYTNIVQLGNKLYQEFRMTLEYKGYIGLYEWDELLTSFKEFIDTLSDPLISKELDNYKIQKVNNVERLGLTQSVLDLTEDGLTPKDISRQLNFQGITILERDIISFLDEYESSPITTKIEKSNISVFDTSQQLELLLKDILTITEEIERLSDEELKNARTTRSEVKLKAQAERRQTLKDAATLAQEIRLLQDNQKFKEVIIKTIQKVDPKVANKIYKELRQASILFNI